ncbi:MAG: hypothetical protein PW790_00140 [Parvibaculaceae bacterium]|nr:hypothetical protein [Parvibaculaceae bacterium]
MQKHIMMGAAVLVASLSAGLSVQAADAPAGSPAGVESPAPGTYEVHDPLESPPVNKRSESDPRFNTKDQHDAEMYAEQYESQQQQKKLQQKQWLDQMDNLGGRASHGIGTNMIGKPITGPQ